MIWFFFILGMGILARLAGHGFGAKWGMAWLPELLYAVPFGLAAGWAADVFGVDFMHALLITAIGTGISYAGMQSATWLFLQWEGHDNPDTTRTSTLKPIVDKIASVWNYKLGDEGYSWVAAAVKGFIIGFPVGAIMCAFLWPLGYEIGSHGKGRVEKYGIDPHAISEILSGIGGGISVFIFVLTVEQIARL